MSFKLSISKKDARAKTPGSLLLKPVGFCLLSLSIIYLLIMQLNKSINGEIVAIVFFVIMLGIAFIFPDLLKGTYKELSTMRIVTFMMVNVICILLLKIGWDKDSLTEIGLNEYWMGVIAFIFGAKATQTYFESKMAVAPSENRDFIYSTAQTAQLAIQQNQAQLMNKFPNIISISDAVKDLTGKETHTVAIYLKDNYIAGLPNSLTAKLSNGTEQAIATEIIANVGNGAIQIAQSTDAVSDVNSPGYQGSICCLVRSPTDKNFIGGVTSGHIYSKGFFESIGGILEDGKKGNARVGQLSSYKWYFQWIDNTQDLAVVELDASASKDDKYQSFKEGYYEVTDHDICKDKPNVTIISKDNQVRDAYILDRNMAMNVCYKNNDIRYISGIILIGDKSKRDDSKTVTKPGDSGSCVFHKDHPKKLIGMILGGDDKFSYVLSISETLSKYNFIPL